MQLTTFCLLALSAAPLLGCGSSSGHTVEFVDPALQEIEPNNNAFEPDSIGAVFSNTYYQIRGSIDDSAAIDEYGSLSGSDRFDGFAFYVEDTVEIEFVLHADNNFADLDLWIYDPFYDEYIAQFESVSSPEYGRVTFPYLGEEFHVVVTSFSGYSDYTLEIIAHPLAGGFVAAAASVSSEQTPSDKSSARMRRYLKAEQQPEPRLQPATVVQLDSKSGSLRSFDALHDGQQLRVIAAKN